MPEHPYLTELASATSNGLLAEEMVFVISRLLREKARPDEEDRKVIETGRAVLDSVADPTPGEARPSLSQLTGSEGALEAIQAVLVQTEDGDVESHVRRLVKALKALEEGSEDIGSYEGDLTDARDLFAIVGRLSLSRANSLTRSPEEQLRWPTSPAISTS
jgi:hypothetical protein